MKSKSIFQLFKIITIAVVILFNNITLAFDLYSENVEEPTHHSKHQKKQHESKNKKSKHRHKKKITKHHEKYKKEYKQSTEHHNKSHKK